MSIDTWVELVALGLAVVAAWLTIPRPPKLHWERLWKVGLSVLTAGEILETHGEPDEASRQRWQAEVLGAIPWNPAVRDADARLEHPRLEEIPVPALEGERALVEELARLPDAPARFQRMFVDDPRVVEELLGDPTALGPDHDPALLLGPGAGWSEVSRWSPELQGVLARRLADLVFVLDGTDPGLAPALTASLEGLRVVEMPSAQVAAPDEAVRLFFEQVEGALSADSDRIVLLGGGLGMRRVLAALAEGDGLRDRCAAVVSLAGRIQGEGPEDQDQQRWLEAHFTQEAMDTELRRSIPFFSVIDVDPLDPLGRAWAPQRFPTPAPNPQGRAPVQLVDLGPLALSRVSQKVLARGLLLLVALYRASRG